MKNDTCKTIRIASGYLSSARVLAIALTLTASATACLAEGTEAQRQACTPDVFRLCSSSIPSVDRIVACLKANRAKLSPACGAVFNTQTAATRSIAPQEDVDFCAFTPGQADTAKTDWQTWCGSKAH